MSSDPTPDERLKRAFDDYDDSTRQVSTNNRAISFGLVAVTYALLSSDSEIAKRIVTQNTWFVVSVGAVGCLGVCFDYLHYMCAAKAADQAIDNKTLDHEHQYSPRWSSWIWRGRFYYARTVAAIVGAVMLIGLIVLSCLSAADIPDTASSHSKLSIVCAEPPAKSKAMRCDLEQSH